jgi:hypothetical protein
MTAVEAVEKCADKRAITVSALLAWASECDDMGRRERAGELRRIADALEAGELVLVERSAAAALGGEA